MLAVAFITFVSILLAPAFSSSTNSCSSCHGGYSQYLDILEGNSGNNLPTMLTVGQTSTVTVVIENRVNTARYTDLSSVSLTLTSQNGHFTVTTSRVSLGTLRKGTATATWQITGVSTGADSLVITASGRNSHNSLSFSDSYSPSPSIAVQSPVPPPPTTYTVTVQLSPNGTTAPASGIYSYTSGTLVTFTAVPNAGYKFDYWQINGVNNPANPTSLSVTSDLTIAPIFTLQPPPPPPPPSNYTVTVQSSPNGTTTPAPGTYSYTSGTPVTFTATPSLGNKFDYWLVNGAANATNPLTVSVVSNLAVSPVFSLQTQPPLPPPTAYAVTVQSSPNGTTTPTSGTYNYTSGTLVSFTATPNAGYQFDFWTINGVANTTNPVTLTISSNFAIAPVFTLQPASTPANYTVTVQLSPNGTTTPASGIYNYTLGSSVTFAATPNSGYSFDYWLVNGATNKTNPMTVRIAANLEIIPAFTKQAEPPATPVSFTVTLLSSINGTTEPPPGTYSRAVGDSVAFTATPNTGHKFNYWLINGETNPANPVTVVVTRDATMEPVFSLANTSSTEPTPPPENQTIASSGNNLTITLLSPAEGEKWRPGTTHNIAWNAVGGTSPLSVKLEYSSSKSDGTWVTIVENAANSGSVAWTVPNISTPWYIRASATDNATNPQSATTSVRIEVAQATPESASFLTLVVILHFAAFGLLFLGCYSAKDKLYNLVRRARRPEKKLSCKNSE